jgi:hypothetical protein
MKLVKQYVKGLYGQIPFPPIGKVVMILMDRTNRNSSTDSFDFVRAVR